MKKIQAYLKSRATIIFICVASLFGGYFVLVTPLLMGGDEAAHFFRIMQLSEGKLLADKLDSGQYGGQIPVNIDQISRLVLVQLPHENENRHVFQPPIQYYDLLKQKPSKDRTTVPFTGSALYSPVAYMPMISGMMVAHQLHISISTTIYILRLVNLITFMALGVLTLWLLKLSKSRWLVLVILLLPMVLFEAATVNGDAILIGLAMLFLSALIRYWHDERPHRTVTSLLIMPAIFMPLAKNIYVFLALLAPVGLVLHKHGKRRSYVYAGGLTIVILLPTLLWGLVTRGPAQAMGLIVQDPIAPISASGQLAFMLGHPLQTVGVFIATPIWYSLDYATGVVGMLGMSWIYAFPTVTIAALVILLIAFSQADDLQNLPLHHSRLWRMSLIGLSSIGLLAMMIGFYITFTPVGWSLVRGIQGRYLIPFIPFLLWGLAGSKRSWIREKTKNNFAAIIAIVIFVNALTMAVVYTLAIHGVTPTTQPLDLL